MLLTGFQHAQIQDALIAAFGDEGNLRQMLRLQMDTNLEAVAKPGTVAQRAFEVVAWADAHGRIDELIQAAVRQNPYNVELLVLAEAVKSWHIAAAEPAEASPYKGLESYGVADAALFFGRAALIGELVTYLEAHSFLAVVGASGSGKSSLVRAGVVPALNGGEIIRDSDKWSVHIITPTARPLHALAGELTKDSESVTAQATLLDDMSSEPRSLDFFAVRLCARTRAARLLLVIDQFEEVFTLCRDPGQRQAFVANLLAAAAAGDRTTVLVTLRADFYAHCAEFEELRTALAQHQVYIGAMARAELREAIVRPAAAGGWGLEPGLEARLLRDVADQPGALPLLSHALLETWKRRSGRLLTLQGYETAGGVSRAVAETAERVYATLTSEEQLAARRIFVRLTAPGFDGAPDTRRRLPIRELAAIPDAEPVLQKLENARLVTAENDLQGALWLEVVHEALIREWPRMQTWLDEDREGLRVQRRLTEAAHEWTAAGRHPDALFSALRVRETLEWVKRSNQNLAREEQEFLGESRKRLDAQQNEQIRAFVREWQQRRAELTRRLQVLAVGILIMLWLLSVAVLNFMPFFAALRNQLPFGARRYHLWLFAWLDERGLYEGFWLLLGLGLLILVWMSVEFTLNHVGVPWFARFAHVLGVDVPRVDGYGSEEA